jgi:hypothetical protein
MLARPSRRAPLPLLLSLLVGLPLVGAAVTASPAATRTLPPSEVEGFVSELDSALPAADPQARALRVTVAQQDEDPDEDGLSNAIEADLGLDPENADTDGDGTRDGDEDTDRDGLTNIDEVRLTHTRPDRTDSDGDGTSDAREDPDKDGLANRFEINRTRTHPRLEDSDRDGIHDGYEDRDGDLLSNKGEQRYKTNPNKRNTDGDRRTDWYEDSDRDGIPNGREQDSGPIPSSLRPKLSRATRDVPPIHDRSCHSRGTDTSPGACTWTFGPRAGRKLVILTGDSHAAHWLPALLKVAEHRGWKLMTITKSSCPVADVQPATGNGDAQDRACVTWRHRAWARIQSLKPDLVIASSLDSYAFRVGSGARSKSDSVWKAALTTSLRRLGKGPTKVLMLGDVYPWGPQGGVLDCLRAHPRNISACSRTRSAPTASWVRGRDRVGTAAARAANARFRSTHDILCPYDPCTLVVDRMLVTRDGGHISATYSREIWRAIDRMIPKL